MRFCINGHRGTSETFLFIKHETIQAKILFSRQGSSIYFLFTKFKSKQVQILYDASSGIEGQVAPSYLSNFISYMLKSYFRDKGHSNIFILRNTKPNRFTYHISYQGTSSNISFIKLVGIQSIISFLRQGSIQYFHFTDTKSNRSTYEVLHQWTSRDK